MYTRTTTIQGEPAKIEAGIAHVRDQVFPLVTEMDGCVGMSLLADRETGRCIATTAWESETAMRDSAESVLPLRDDATEVLGGTSSDVGTWEMAVVHRDHAVPSGACARVTWLSGPAEIADHAIDTFRMVVLPRVQELDGFCSGSLMINRATGRAVGTITFDSREHLLANRPAAARIREEASSTMGATIDEVAEMEVAFAHLHVPELV